MQSKDAKELVPPPAPKPDPETSKDGTSEGTLDLDQGEQINNQHLEVR